MPDDSDPSIASKYPPRAEEHQRAIVGAIVAVFSFPKPSFEALGQGGSRVLEKLVRSYHYWASEYPPTGVCPYDKLHLNYFRLTPSAYDATPAVKLHCEHAVPIQVLVRELCDRRKAHAGSVSIGDVEFVMAANEIVVVTAEEARRLNTKGGLSSGDVRSYRQSMPACWKFGDDPLARIHLICEQPLEGYRLIGPENQDDLYRKFEA